MSKNLDEYISRAQELIDKGNQVLSTKRAYTHVAGEFVDRTRFADFRTSSLSFLGRVFGTGSPYISDFEKKVSSTFPNCVESGIGILSAAKEELEGGWLISTKSIISAEIFSDFIEMAEYLLSEGYKDPAAVIIGSVLEEHLRQLCLHKNIDTTYEKSGKRIPKKADLLNSELAKEGVYNKLDQKSLTTSLDLRNKAAHGKYDEYSKSQVELMLNSVTDFISRISA